MKLIGSGPKTVRPWTSKAMICVVNTFFFRLFICWTRENHYNSHWIYSSHVVSARCRWHEFFWFRKIEMRVHRHTMTHLDTTVHRHPIHRSHHHRHRRRNNHVVCVFCIGQVPMASIQNFCRKIHRFNECPSSRVLFFIWPFFSLHSMESTSVDLHV